MCGGVALRSEGRTVVCLVVWPWCVMAMCRRELQDGVTLVDKDGRRVGRSATAAKEGIGAVLVSRIMMGAPGMGG